jgi:organic radical activating enzyme
MFKEIKEIHNPSNDFHINLLLHNVCNYSCKYCNSCLHNGSGPKLTTQDYISFLSNLLYDNESFFNKKQKKITLTGGEPTLFLNIESFLDYLKQQQFEIAMITNGSSKLEKYNKLFDSLHTVYISYHPRYANIKHIKELTRLALSKNVFVEFNLMMDPHYWNRAIEAIDVFKEMKDVTINVIGIRDIGGVQSDNQYTQEHKTFLQNNTTINPRNLNIKVVYSDDTIENLDASDILNKKLNNFNGYNCDINLNNLSINQHGVVSGGVCCLPRYGNLFKNKDLRIKLTEKKFICTSNKCDCPIDIFASKRKL